MRTARLAALLAATAAAAAVSAAPASAASCSVKGLEYEYRDGGARFGADVKGLRAGDGASCKVARRIARTTMLALLFGDAADAPKRPEGYRLKLDEPCGGCPPEWKAVARRGERTVRFTVRGGA